MPLFSGSCPLIEDLSTSGIFRYAIGCKAPTLLFTAVIVAWITFPFSSSQLRGMKDSVFAAAHRNSALQLGQVLRPDSVLGPVKAELCLPPAL